MKIKQWSNYLHFKWCLCTQHQQKVQKVFLPCRSSCDGGVYYMLAVDAEHVNSTVLKWEKEKKVLKKWTNHWEPLKNPLKYETKCKKIYTSFLPVTRTSSLCGLPPRYEWWYQCIQSPWYISQCLEQHTAPSPTEHPNATLLLFFFFKCLLYYTINSCKNQTAAMAP